MPALLPWKGFSAANDSPSLSLFFTSFLCLFSLLPQGCASPETQSGPPLRRLDGLAWGTTWSLMLEGNEDLQPIIQGHLDAWGSTLSTYQADSEIHRLNSMAMGESRPVSLRMERALSLSLDLCRRSGGLFDPLLGQFMMAHGFEPNVRNTHGIRSSVPVSLSGRLHCESFDLSHHIFTRRSPDLLNLNAIAEGLAMQEVAEDLRQRGVRRFLFELGGELIAGEAPALRPEGWWVGVESAQTGQLFQSFSLRQASLSTSGTYRNVRGRHSHLIDPGSGAPVPAGPKSASVICDRADTADGLATLLAVAPWEQGPNLVALFPGCEALIQSADRLWHSKKWPQAEGASDP